MSSKASQVPLSDWPLGADGPARTVSRARTPSARMSGPEASRVVSRAGLTFPTDITISEPRAPKAPKAPAGKTKGGAKAGTPVVPAAPASTRQTTTAPQDTLYAPGLTTVLSPRKAVRAARLKQQGKTHRQIAMKLGTTTWAVSYAFARIRTGKVKAPEDIVAFVESRARGPRRRSPSPRRSVAQRRADLIAFANTPEGTTVREFIASQPADRTPPLSMRMMEVDLDHVALGVITALPEEIRARLKEKRAQIHRDAETAPAISGQVMSPETPADTTSAEVAPADQVPARETADKEAKTQAAVTERMPAKTRKTRKAESVRSRSGAKSGAWEVPSHALVEADALVFEVRGARVSVPLSASGAVITRAVNGLAALAGKITS